mmetsp:Transcript_4618/g.13265  ORF Transcript_4618/g.13265 Transcript_4618/m.13265 type:complete len:252 (+) Transcript_4618:2424-3179(+)
MSPGRPPAARGGFSHEWRHEASVTSLTTGCTAREMVPARKGCNGSSSKAHSSQARSGSGALNLGGSNTRWEQHMLQKILPHSLQWWRPLAQGLKGWLQVVHAPAWLSGTQVGGSRLSRSPPPPRTASRSQWIGGAGGTRATQPVSESSDELPSITGSYPACPFWGLLIWVPARACHALSEPSTTSSTVWRVAASATRSRSSPLMVKGRSAGNTARHRGHSGRRRCTLAMHCRHPLCPQGKLTGPPYEPSAS